MYGSITISSGTLTLSMSQTRPTSLRSRSTIIRCSAIVFSSCLSSSRRPASTTGSSWREIVPLIGRASTRRSRSTERKRSGEELTIARSPNFR